VQRCSGQEGPAKLSKVQRSSVGCALACCTTGPGSILSLALMEVLLVNVLLAGGQAMKKISSQIHSPFLWDKDDYVIGLA
jgi:hypothetical protein